MMNTENIKTSLTVALPDWLGDGDFMCELKRPSLLAMAACGAIPNPLLPVARKLFFDGGFNPDKGNLAEDGEILLAVAKAAMIEPSFDELAARGIDLTDEQLVAIWKFVQGGAKMLDRFRQLTDVSEPVVRGAEVSE